MSESKTPSKPNDPHAESSDAQLLRRASEYIPPTNPKSGWNTYVPAQSFAPCMHEKVGQLTLDLNSKGVIYVKDYNISSVFDVARQPQGVKANTRPYYSLSSLCEPGIQLPGYIEIARDVVLIFNLILIEWLSVYVSWVASSFSTCGRDSEVQLYAKLALKSIFFAKTKTRVGSDIAIPLPFSHDTQYYLNYKSSQNIKAWYITINLSLIALLLNK